MERTREMKSKDLIIELLGLYTYHRENGTISLTNLKNATHYSTKTSAKDAIKKMWENGFRNMTIIDNRKRKKDNRKNRKGYL
jgi:hypothetical protein